MKNLTDKEKAIVELIKQRGTIFGAELEVVFDLNTRGRYAVIEQLRTKGAPIVADKQNKGGYWFARSKEEVLEYDRARQLEHRKHNRQVEAMLNFFE